MELRQVKAQLFRAAGWLTVVVPGVLFLGLGLESMRQPPARPYPDFRAVAHWFDPVFFQYTVILTSLAVVIVPMVALCYVGPMVARKQRRLGREIPESRRLEIEGRMANRIKFGEYLGSVALATIVVMLGASILLLFKPAQSGVGGVNFGLGANMLMLGPFIKMIASSPQEVYARLICSLTAFQFGFLGAYIYFIGSLARAYFTLDLTPHTFVDGAIRMVVASVLALVVSFAPGFCSSYSGCGAPIEVATSSQESVTQQVSLSAVQSGVLAPDAGTASVPAGCEASKAASTLGLLPLLSFFFGFYPKQAILLIQRVASKSANLAGEVRRTLPLSILAGMSYSHEIRLEREGFDNVENLSHADPVDLAVRTGFSYGQLAQWVEEAWLVVHLREDYPAFVQASGITSRAEFRQCLQHGIATEAAVELLIQGIDEQSVATRLKAKLLAVSALIDPT